MAAVFDQARAEQWAEALCSRAEYAAGEIREKLIRKGLPSGQADEVVARLAAKRFVDDERFARAFVRDKVRFAHWGKLKISQALRLKRVSRDVIEAALAEIDPDEYIASLAALLQAKMRSMKADPAALDYAARVKLYRFAASRGYDSASIAEALEAGR